MSELLRQQALLPGRSVVARLTGRSPLTADTRPWYWGALGELAVGRHLGDLGPEWRVLHAVPVGAAGSDIDHVVIGPGGVFTINTKNHSGQTVWVAGHTFMIAGRRQPHIRNAEHEARRAARLLSAALGRPVPVIPVVAVVDPQRLTVKEPPREVQIVTASRVRRWLQRRPVMLGADDVATVARHAARPETWTRHPVPGGDCRQLREAFAALDDQVRGARRIRLFWRIAVASALVMMAISALPG